jgi:hypothetical protein
MGTMPARPQLAMKTNFEQADVALCGVVRRSKLSLNCRAAFPGHLRLRNAMHARATLAGLCCVLFEMG